jgi:hypothetical protein
MEGERQNLALQETSHTLISSTTCSQNTSKSLTFSGIPRNLRTGSPSFSFSFPFSNFSPSAPSVDSLFSSAGAGDVGLVGSPHPASFLNSRAGLVTPFARARVRCALTRSASRRAAASSWRFTSSASSFSASRAAYAAKRSISAITICLMLTLICSCAVAERNEPRV